jgi:hypothetical protein
MAQVAGNADEFVADEERRGNKEAEERLSVIAGAFS